MPSQARYSIKFNMEQAIETNKCGKTHPDKIDIDDHAILLRKLAAMGA